MNQQSMSKKRLISFSFLFLMILQFTGASSAVLTTFDDYQFVTNTQIQADTWVFDLTVKDNEWSVTGRILTYQFYHINSSNATESINYISPVDILLGTGDISDNPSNYNFSYSWGFRYVNVSFSAAPSEVSGILSNLGNIHAIARTQEALINLKSIQNGTIVKLSGYLVDVGGWSVNGSINWKTDTQFGNEDCEILVISDIIPADVGRGDIMVMATLAVLIGVSAVITIVLHRRRVRSCKRKDIKKIGKTI